MCLCVNALVNLIENSHSLRSCGWCMPTIAEEHSTHRVVIHFCHLSIEHLWSLLSFVSLWLSQHTIDTNSAQIDEFRFFTHNNLKICVGFNMNDRPSGDAVSVQSNVNSHAVHASVSLFRFKIRFKEHRMHLSMMRMGLVLKKTAKDDMILAWMAINKTENEARSRRNTKTTNTRLAFKIISHRSQASCSKQNVCKKSAAVWEKKFKSIHRFGSVFVFEAVNCMNVHRLQNLFAWN